MFYFWDKKRRSHNLKSDLRDEIKLQFCMIRLKV